MSNDVINGSWIRARLPNRRGAVADMGRALGIGTSEASKILGDTRNVQPSEFFPLMKFLGFTVVAPSTAQEALAEIMQQASDLNENGLSLLREQAASLTKVPELQRQPSGQPQEQ